jgi:hypothetical protein
MECKELSGDGPRFLSSNYPQHIINTTQCISTINKSTVHHTIQSYSFNHPRYQSIQSHRKHNHYHPLTITNHTAHVILVHYLNITLSPNTIRSHSRHGTHLRADKDFFGESQPINNQPGLHQCLSLDLNTVNRHHQYCPYGSSFARRT